MIDKLVATAACPQRVFFAVFQELAAGDTDVQSAGNNNMRLRTVTVVAGRTPTPAWQILQTLLDRSLRGERTVCLLGPGTRPTLGWDERLLEDLAVAQQCAGGTRAVLTSPQAPSDATLPLFATWEPGVVAGARPLLGPSATTPVPVIRASSSFCAAASRFWKRVEVHVRDPAADLALSATLWRAGARLHAPRRHIGLSGGESWPSHSQAPGEESMEGVTRKYTESVGVRGDVVSGRARMGLCRVPSEVEIVAKYGSRDEMQRMISWL